MKVEPGFFCSARSRAIEENIYGTASMGQVWLLLEHPQPWGLRPLRDTKLSDAVKQHLHETLTTIPRSRLLLMKQRAPKNDFISFYVAVTRERRPGLYQFALETYADLLELNLPRLVAGQSDFGVVQRTQPLFLVCADGKHDKCCAKYGLPIYAALKSCVGEAAWQSSHVGGDRFAGNLVCFPHGVFYGRVDRADVEPLVYDYLDGRLRLENYRGRACYSFEVQAADYFARAESGITGLDELFLTQQSRAGEHVWQIQFQSSDGRIHQVTIRAFRSQFSNYLRCQALQEEHVNQYELLSYEVTESASVV